jgi:aspartyl-tRNA(Asn)/glutamyl-tRNA(Gln) amidotransferase subunit B
MPGVLPVINKRAVEFTIMTALALNCEIPPYSKFDRKNYPYPDLMKGYQISQYDMPMSRNGWLEIEVDGRPKRIGIRRVHLEEDTARLLHRVDPVTGESYTLIDVNRSGVPLMEIVTEPDISSPEEAGIFLRRLRQVLRYLGVSTGNMEEGSYRCDANVSIQPEGAVELGTKVEVKNMNSFRAVERALSYEVERQRSVLESGGVVVQETRGWVEDQGITVGQRTKEYAHDYRYFPEPDLPPLVLAREWVEEIRKQLPELPAQRKRRLIEAYSLNPAEADLLTESRAWADYFEAAVQGRNGRLVKAICNWILGDLRGYLNERKLEIEQSPVSPQNLAQLVELVETGRISRPLAKQVFGWMFDTGKPPAQIMAEQNLGLMADNEGLKEVVAKAIEENPGAVQDYRSGRKQALGFLVGQVMRLTRGQADPNRVAQLLRQTLEETT